MAEVEMREVLRLYRSRGYTTSFQAARSGAVTCMACQSDLDPHHVRLEALHRLEGASDPDSMAAVLALVCPACDARGTMVAQYGPEITPEEATVLAGLQDHRRENPLASGW